MDDVKKEEIKQEEKKESKEVLNEEEENLLKEKKSRKINRIIIIVAIIVIILLSCCIVFFAINSPDDNNKVMKDTSKNGDYIVDAKAFSLRAEYMIELSKFQKLFKSSNGGMKITLKDIVDITNNYNKDPYGGYYDFDNSYILIKNGDSYIYLTSCQKDENKKCKIDTTYSIGTSSSPLKVKSLKDDSVK